MSFDNSRIIYNSWKDYLGTITLQGRVQLDSDWNDFQGQFLRRLQAGTLDTIGPAVYPAALPNSFLIQATNTGGVNQIQIGAGRMYVDGLLVENHGPMGPHHAPTSIAQWDPVLAELSNTYPGAAFVGVDFFNQPYYPNPVVPGSSASASTVLGAGPYVVYLDVWQRAVTYLEDHHLREIAVGVDTTGRLQTVWQVKLLDVSGANPAVTCASVATLPAWLSATQSSGGQLTTSLNPPPQTGPCILTATSGYTGMENQFYRVEIHQPGGFGTATFKWSRENASVMTSVLGVNTSASNTAGKTACALSVESLGRDQVLGFTSGYWIELLDDYLELHGLPGELYLIDSVTPSTKTITLVTPLQANSRFANGLSTANQHTRIRRWDQQGTVYQSDYQTVVTDLGQPGSSGDVPLSASGIQIVLENGVTVALALNANLGQFKTGDFWTFAARTANSSVEILTAIPPRGIHHHYTPLSVVTNFTGSASNCRTPWPPAPVGTTSCGCTVIIGPDDVTATNTLQQILNQVISQGQGSDTVICLRPGTYGLPAPLRIPSGTANLAIEACQSGTAVLSATGPASGFLDGLVSLYGSNNVTLSGLHFTLPVTPLAEATGAGLLATLRTDVKALAGLTVSIGVRAVNCTGLTIELCQFDFSALADLDSAFGVGVFASGQCRQWRLAGNEFTGNGTFQAGFLLAPSVLSFNTPKKKPIVINRGPSDTLVRGEAFIENATATVVAASQGGKVVASSLSDAVFANNSFSELTVAALIHAQCQAVDFQANKCTDCLAGFWLVAPTQAELVLYDPQGVAQDLVMVVGLLVAIAYPLPSQTAPAPATVAVPAAPTPIRIYAGVEKTDDEGNEWLPDSKYATDGSISPVYQEVMTGLDGTDTPGSGDSFIYLIERYGNKFSYTFNNLTAAYYTVTLKFAEIYYTGQAGAGPVDGTRVFTVSINGTPCLINFNVAADAGGALIADDKVFYNVTPANVAANKGQIVIEFQGTTISGDDQNAKISGVEITPQWTGTVPAAASGANAQALPIFSIYAQLTQLAQQSFASLAPAALQLRLADNELHSLTATGILVLWDDQLQNRNVSSLMMTGNRLDTRLIFGNEDAARLLYDFWSNEISRSNFSVYNFNFGVNITWVTRCVISGNMILNQNASASGQFKNRASLLLNNLPLPRPVTTVPPAEVMVSANVFQGLPVIIPQRSFPSDTKLYPPLNSWNFLNTIVP